MPKQTTAQTPTPRRRRPGRRPKDGNGVSRETIIECAIRIARNESLLEVSMVRVAKELGVVPGLIHYHMGSRDELLSSVINWAFRERIEAMPALTGDWREDIDKFARSTLKNYLSWPDLATYILTKNKFRLFQQTEDDGLDYGALFFDHIGRIFAGARVPAFHAAWIYHALMLFVAVVAAEIEHRQAPGLHHDYITSAIGRLSQERYPGAYFFAEAFASLDSETTFDNGLKMFLDAIDALRKTG